MSKHHHKPHEEGEQERAEPAAEQVEETRVEETEVEAAEAPAEGEKKDEPKAPKRGIGTVAMETLRAGKSNEEVLAAIKAEFPESNTTMASVNWYRNKLRSEGEDVPTARSLGAAARADAKAKRDAEKAAEKAKKKAERDAAKKRTATTTADAVEQDRAQAAAAGGETGDTDFLA